MAAALDYNFGLACMRGDTEEVRRCIAAGIDVNRSRSHTYPAIYWASDAGHLDVVRVLLEHGADPNGLGPNKDSALERACQNDKIAVARLLLERGASVDSCNSRTRKTPLHHAWANSTMTRLLLAYGAKFDRKDATGSTPLFLARMTHRPDVHKVWDDYLLTHWLPLRIKLNAIGPLADSPHSSARRRVVADEHLLRYLCQFFKGDKRAADSKGRPAPAGTLWMK